MVYWVGLYTVDRAYGGPEEGGWYYDTGTLVTDANVYRRIGAAPRSFLNEDAAHAYALELNEAIRREKINEGLHEPSSVLSEGEWVQAETHEHILPTHYPEHTPHYE